MYILANYEEKNGVGSSIGVQLGAQRYGEDLSWTTCRCCAHMRDGVQVLKSQPCSCMMISLWTPLLTSQVLQGENKLQICFVDDNVEYRRTYVDKCECVSGVSFIDSFSHFSFHSFVHCGTCIPS